MKCYLHIFVSMYTITQDQFNVLKSRNGIVIVEVEAVRNAVSDKGTIIVANTDYTMAQTATKKGVVAKAPQNSELKEGDVVHFDYMIAMNIMLNDKGIQASNDSLLRVGEKKYFIIPQNQIYYYNRNGQKHALNGLVIASKVDEDIFECQITSDRLDGLKKPKERQRFLYNGTPVPTEPEYLSKEVLYRISPKYIYAIEE